MSVHGRDELHRFAQNLLGAYLMSAASKVRPQAEVLANAAKEFLESERCAELIDQFMKTLVGAVANQIQQERRADPFRRLMCHPLTNLLESGAISRTLLPIYFHFLHLVLGDGQAEITAKCEAIIEELRHDPHFSWDMFYDDLPTKQLQWDVLMRIAETFKRFELRRDWFIELMQNRPHAVSLSAQAFVPLQRNEEEDKAPFGVLEFNLMFNALFRPLLSLSGPEDSAFARQFGAPPGALVRPLVEKLV